MREDARMDTEKQAQELAQYHPASAIRGWLAGYEAHGDAANAAICERALEIQGEWQQQQQR